MAGIADEQPYAEFSSIGISPRRPPSFLGISLNSSLRSVFAARISAPDVLTLEAPRVLGSARSAVSAETLSAIRRLELAESTVQQRQLVSIEVTNLAGDLANRLVRQIDDTGDVLAIGVHGCHLWASGDAESPACENLLIPTMLAEQTGITVIDDFPARDLAQGGMGGPMEAHGLALLLADRERVRGRRWRAVLDLTLRALHCTVLPPLDDMGHPAGLFSWDIGPGTSLIHELMLRAGIPSGEHPDCSKLAVQGSVLPAVFELWHNTIGRAELQWHPTGKSVLPLIYALDQNARFQRATIHDLLATAVHFMADRVEQFVTQRTVSSQPIGELLVAGGREDGLLVRELRRRLPVLQIQSIENLGYDDSLFAAAAAGLALMHVRQIPLPPSAGGSVPRLLGSLTPGNPANWCHVLREMAIQAPWAMPLRTAM